MFHLDCISGEFHLCDSTLYRYYHYLIGNMAEGGDDGSDKRKKMNYEEFRRIENKIAVS